MKLNCNHVIDHHSVTGMMEGEVIDMTCRKCGVTGSIQVFPEDVMWDEPRPKTPEVSLDEFTRAYIACAFWSSVDWSREHEPLDQHYSEADLAPEALESMIKDCASFQEAHMSEIAHDLSRAGHDFWLTRNHHGSGFWDGDPWPRDVGENLTKASYAYGECDLYVGDDGKIHIT